MSEMVPAATEEASNFRDRFKFEGKEYQIFKRVPSKDANYWIQFVRRGKRFFRSLDTNVKSVAIANAKILIGAVRREHWAVVDGTKLRGNVAPIGRILEVYASHPDEREGKTISGNVSALKGMIRRVHGPEVNVEGLSSAILTGAFVRAYKDRVMEEAEDLDEVAEQRMCRTANSYLRQARSIFAAHVLEVYEDEGLRLPDLRGFLEAVGFRKVGKREYHEPAADLLAETYKRLDNLREADASAFAAICLACGTGMRKGEIGKAKWSWFEQRTDGVFVRSDVLSKNGGVIHLPVLGDWWKRLQALRADQLAAGEVSDWVIPGTKTERTDEVFRRVSEWMRGLGWKTQKTIHEFRAYVGSKVAEAHGIETASMFLRHADLRTTKDFYMRYQEMRKVDGVKLFAGAAA